MTATERLAALSRTIEQEIAALDRNDLDALAAATAEKLRLVELLRDGIADQPLPPALVAQVRALNQEAGRRVNLARAAVERRLARFAVAKGVQPLTYGPNGRPTTSR